MIEFFSNNNPNDTSNLEKVYLRPRDSIQVRHNILDLVNNKEQFTLFVLGYSAMLNAPDFATNAASFWQLGGIHGQPYNPYVGEGGGVGISNTGWGGYCHHGMVTFPTWHRAYVLYVENAMLYYAFVALQTYKSNEDLYKRMLYAFSTLRFPYLNWDIANFHLPTIFRESQVSIIGTNGQNVFVDNPLNKYKLQGAIPPVTSGGQVVFTGTTAGTYTIRFGSTKYPDEYSPDYDLEDNTCVMYNTTCVLPTLFQAYLNDDYTTFSNHYNVVTDGKSETATATGGTVYGWLASLELVHDYMHDCIGGNGQMSFPDTAGLDPIFFLHHCNVDRVFAIWQAANWGGNNSWFDNANNKETSNSGSFTILPNQPMKSTTELEPFRVAKDKSYVTSDQLRNWEDWGYTYPDVLDPSYKSDPFKFKLNLLAKMGMEDQHLLDAIHWNLTVQGLSKSYYGGAYSIRFYLSDVGNTYKGIRPDFKGFIGIIPVFAKGPQCENCVINNTVNGQLHLNRVMVQNGIATAPEPDLSDPKNPYAQTIKELQNAIVYAYYDKRGNMINPPPNPPTLAVTYTFAEGISNIVGSKKSVVTFSAKRGVTLPTDARSALQEFNNRIHNRKEE